MLRKTHKGPRLQVNVYLPGVVVRRIDQDTERCAISSRSQLLADRVSAWYGRHDLVRELDREQLEFAVPTRDPAATAPASHGDAPTPEEQEVALRVPRDVVRLIDQDAQRNGNLARRHHLARVLVAMYDPQRSREQAREEQLELSVSSRHEPAA